MPGYGGAALPFGYPKPRAAQQQGLDDQAHRERSRQAQQQGIADQRSQMSLLAQKNALTQQQRLMDNDENPRTTTGESMEISNMGGSPRSSSQTSGTYGNSAYDQATQLQQQMQALQAFQGQLAPQAQLQRVAAPTPPRLSGPSRAFSHAKDVSGRTGSAAIKALHDLMSRRGMSDSGLETAGESEILGNVARQQSDAEYGAVEKDAAQQWQAAQLGYQGDMNQAQTAYQGQIQQNGQQQNLLQQLLARMRF